MEEKKLTDEATIDSLKEMAIKFSKDIYVNRVLENAIDLIHRLQADSIQLKWNYVDLKERYVKVLDLNEKVIAEQKEEIERLKKRRGVALLRNDDLDLENYELKKQVDELKDERENMQAEILGFEDMKFTQEHCDLYSENETLKQWLKRLNADLEYEKNWGKIQTKQAVKDTAKGILQAVDEESNGQTLSVTNVLRKRYGVEVE